MINVYTKPCVEKIFEWKEQIENQKMLQDIIETDNIEDFEA